MTPSRPKIGLTMGDATGIGPEVLLRSLLRMRENRLCDPILIGDSNIFQRAAQFVGIDVNIQTTDQPEAVDPDSHCWTCWNPCKTSDLSSLPLGTPQAAAGKAAFDCLNGAIDLALDGEIDGITTAPLHKEALHLAGIQQPGHTEILAERCGVTEYAMMLYLPQGEIISNPHGLSVAHVTLHTSIQSVPELLTTEAVQEKIQLVDSFLKRIGCFSPRIGVCALNPHGGEQGLFGDEESRIIEPAVQKMKAAGVDVAGPFPADTLLKRAVCESEFDGIIAMYHDQGHIALKLIGFNQAVNITLGLPIVRTSPSHGTAFDKVGKVPADETGMWEAVCVATQLAASK